MRETNIRQEIFRLFRISGFWPITQTDATRCSKCGSFFYPPKGRPDILCLNPRGRAFVVEVKVGETSFPKNHITQDQREWMNNYVNAGGLAFIALGTLRRPRQLFIVPWQEWLAIENAYPERQSVPASAAELQQFALRRVNGGWAIPPKHPLAFVANIGGAKCTGP